MIQPLDGFERRRLIHRCVDMMRDRFIKRVVDQRRFARTGNTSNANECAHRQIEGDVFQIVAGCSLDAQYFFQVHFAAFLGHRNLLLAGQILAGQRLRGALDFFRCSLRYDLATVHAGSRPHVDHMIGHVDGVFVVLDYDNRVAKIA